MPKYILEAGRPDDDTYEVGTGPFPDLPAGTYKGNFYGNDPRLGRIGVGDQRYSLPDSPGDASSSGNTFQVGTGPQPGLPAGRFTPDEVKKFFRDQERTAAAEIRAAADAARIPDSFVPTTSSVIPAQTTLPNPVAPVAVPSFVPATGIPNFGVNNLLAIGAAGVPGATGAIGPTGVPGIPGISSPLQSLLPPASTVPATGSNTLAVPNIASNIPTSVFSQLFPSVPDISQTAPATVAHGGPILASDSLPRYQDGGEAEKALESEIITELNEIFVERGGMSPPQFYELVKGKSLPELVAMREAQQNADESFFDRFPSLRGFSSPDAPPKNYYPPGYEFPEEGPTELDAFDRSLDMDEIPPRARNELDALRREFQRDLQSEWGQSEWGQANPLRYYQPIVPYVDPDLPEPVRRSIEEGGFYGPEAANGGPILASEYLNAGGPVQYFKDAGTVNGYPGGFEDQDTTTSFQGPTANLSDAVATSIIESQDIVDPQGKVKISAPLETPLNPEDLDPEDPLTKARIGPFSILDAIRTAATLAIPALAVPNAVINAVQALNAMNQNKNPGGLIGYGVEGLNKAGFDVTGFLEGKLDTDFSDTAFEPDFEDGLGWEQKEP